MRKYIFILLFVPILSFSQQFSKLDSIALNIPDVITYSPNKLAVYIKENTKTNDEIVRVLYVWIVNNIRYENESDKKDSLKNIDLVQYSLKTKSGNCKNYSALLSSICNILGIEAYSVLGYTRFAELITTDQDHAWNIIKLDSTYYLFDPTWDASLKQFNLTENVFKFQYFKKNSDNFIKTHMPYDHMMQLKYYPITHKDFFIGNTKGLVYMNYKELFVEYNQLNECKKLKLMLKRTEKNGIEIPELIFLYNKLKQFVSTSCNN